MAKLDLRNQTFGVEVELVKIERKTAALAIAEYFGTHARYAGYEIGYDAWTCTDRKGRTWKFMRDSSLTNADHACEVVTPICTYDDLEDVQEVVRILRGKGAKADGSCGIHVHVGADKHDARSLLNLVKIFRSKEDMLYKALAITGRRECTYTKKVNCNLAARIEKGERPANMEAWEHLWYESQGYTVNGKHNHYNDTRYHGLNLHATFSKGTVEFRLFNGTTHAGKVKAYVQFCLAVSALAINSRSIKMDRTVSDNEKYTFRCWLLRLGLIGDEFKTCRTHMMANLQGCSAWRHGHAA